VTFIVENDTLEDDGVGGNGFVAHGYDYMGVRGLSTVRKNCLTY
jgi:hypothetical protein